MWLLHEKLMIIANLTTTTKEITNLGSPNYDIFIITFPHTYSIRNSWSSYQTSEEGKKCDLLNNNSKQEKSFVTHTFRNMMRNIFAKIRAARTLNVEHKFDIVR